MVKPKLGSPTSDAAESDDALVVESFEYSVAQRNYQIEARLQALAVCGGRWRLPPACVGPIPARQQRRDAGGVVLQGRDAQGGALHLVRGPTASLASAKGPRAVALRGAARPRAHVRAVRAGRGLPAGARPEPPARRGVPRVARRGGRGAGSVPLRGGARGKKGKERADAASARPPSRRKRCEPARRDGDPKGPSERPRVGIPLRYRIELGSYRQGDRRFVIRASIAGSSPKRHGDGSPTARPARLLPAHTPPARVPRPLPPPPRPGRSYRRRAGRTKDPRPPPLGLRRVQGEAAPRPPARGGGRRRRRRPRVREPRAAAEAGAAKGRFNVTSPCVLSKATPGRKASTL